MSKQEGESLSARRLTYHYLMLPYITRIQIARELGVLTDEDLVLPELEWHKLVFERAKERGLLRQMWDACQEAKEQLP